MAKNKDPMKNTDWYIRDQAKYGVPPIPPIPVLNLDKYANEIYGGRWISAESIESWLDERITELNESIKIRKADWKEAIRNAFRYMKNNLEEVEKRTAEAKPVTEDENEE